MRWLINYIRPCFCKHDWEHEKDINHIEYSINVPIGFTRVCRCKKVWICSEDQDVKKGKLNIWSLKQA